MKATMVGHFEYRVRCDRYGDDGHRGHAYTTKPPLDAKVASCDNDTAMGKPGNVGCVPWHGEARFVSAWSEDVTGLTVAAARWATPLNLFDTVDVS